MLDSAIFASSTHQTYSAGRWLLGPERCVNVRGAAAARAFATRGAADHVVAYQCLSLLGFVGRRLPAAGVSRGYSAVEVSADRSARACVSACRCVRLGVLGDLTCQSLRPHRCVVAALRLRQFMSRKREPKTVPKSWQTLCCVMSVGYYPGVWRTINI